MIRLALFILFFLWVVRAPFAYRDSVRASVENNNPEVYLPKQEREKAQLFVYASENYKPGDPRRTQATCDLALVRWQRLLFDDAEKLYRVAVKETKPTIGFNQTLEDNMLHLGNVLIVQKKFDEAGSYYLKILSDDQKYFPKSDIRIGRDYNNLGLNTYLKALSKDRGEERAKLLQQANDFYKQALKIYRTQPNTKQAIAVVLDNEHLSMRDRNELDNLKLASSVSPMVR